MKTLENTDLFRKKVGAGHFEVTASYNLGEEENTILVTDMSIIDDAFNTDFDNECTSYDSVDEAKQALIDKIFNQ